MTRNIIFAGVGGQGILSVATIIGDAATRTGINLKQAEVHGMSQRGGDVQSNMRLSTETIWSDLIAVGEADVIISMEPMEALRYLPFLHKDGWIITSTDAFKNIPSYPDDDAIEGELKKIDNLVAFPIEKIAKDNGIPKCANVILLGMASRYLSIISGDELKQSIINIFARKGEKVVEMNLKAFDLGLGLTK
jgi:Pyruvate:ferredoxin oxidoreductase and related 2-oxoacid:ferredoxin oxidoreductases, gamma subunit